MRISEVHEGTVVLVADPYPPYQYMEQGDVKGVDQDLVAAALKRLGRCPKTSLLPWDECLRRVDKGEADGVFQITRTPDRAARYLFSDRLRTATTVLLGRAGLGLRLHEEAPLGEQLAAYKVGVIAGYSYHPAIDTLPAVGVEQQEELLHGLAQGQFDVVAMDIGVARFLTRKLSLSEMQPIEGFSVEREMYVAFRRDLHELVRGFNRQLAELVREGLPEKIALSYGL